MSEKEAVRMIAGFRGQASSARRRLSTFFACASTGSSFKPDSEAHVWSGN